MRKYFTHICQVNAQLELAAYVSIESGNRETARLVLSIMEEKSLPTTLTDNSYTFLELYFLSFLLTVRYRSHVCLVHTT